MQFRSGFDTQFALEYWYNDADGPLADGVVVRGFVFLWKLFLVVMDFAVLFICRGMVSFNIVHFEASSFLYLCSMNTISVACKPSTSVVILFHILISNQSKQFQP